MKKPSVLCHLFLFLTILCVSPYTNAAEGIRFWTSATLPAGICVQKICYKVFCPKATVGARAAILTRPITNGDLSIQISKSGSTIPPQRVTDKKPTSPTDLTPSVTGIVSGGSGDYDIKVFSNFCFKNFDHDSSIDCLDSSKRSFSYVSLSQTDCN